MNQNTNEKGEEWIQREEIAYYLTRVAQVQVARRYGGHGILTYSSACFLCCLFGSIRWCQTKRKAYATCFLCCYVWLVLGNPSRFCYSISSPSQHKSTQMLPYSRSYSRFVTADSDSPLDRSHGQVQLIDGDLYYSPNSQCSVHVPPVYDNIPFSDNFKDSFSRFRQPLWWQPACPYLAFVPTQPVFAGVPFQDLFHISIFPRRSDRSYAINPKIILGWASLERDIRDAANLILAHERAPPITWLISTSLGCTGGYRYVRLLQTEYRNSKGWFSLFMGGLSYAIAISISQR